VTYRRPTRAPAGNRTRAVDPYDQDDEPLPADDDFDPPEEHACDSDGPADYEGTARYHYPY